MAPAITGSSPRHPFTTSDIRQLDIDLADAGQDHPFRVIPASNEPLPSITGLLFGKLHQHFTQLGLDRLRDQLPCTRA